MADGVQGYMGAQGRPPALNPAASVSKQLGPLRCSKGLVSYVYPPPLLLAHRASYNNKGYKSHIPNGPLDGWGLLKLRVQK
jgi:hypothetical protein